MALEQPLAVKKIGHDGERKVPPAASRTRVTGVFVAFVEDFQLLRGKYGQAFADHAGAPGIHGSTFLKGLTVTR